MATTILCTRVDGAVDLLNLEGLVKKHTINVGYIGDDPTGDICATLSGNGEFLAVKCSDYSFSTFNVASGLQLRRFDDIRDSVTDQPKQCEISAIGFTQTGHTVLRAGEGGIIAYDMKSGDILYQVRSYLDGFLTVLKVSPDDKTFVVGDGNGEVAQFSVDEGSCIYKPGVDRAWFHSLDPDTEPTQLFAVAWAPDSEIYYLGYEDGQVTFVKSTFNLCESHPDNGLIIEPDGNPVNSLCVSPDGKHVAVAGGYSGTHRGFVSVWETGSSKLVWKQPVDSYVYDVWWSQDGENIATSGSDHVRQWNATNGGNVPPYC